MGHMDVVLHPYNMLWRGYATLGSNTGESFAKKPPKNTKTIKASGMMTTAIFWPWPLKSARAFKSDPFQPQNGQQWVNNEASFRRGNGGRDFDGDFKFGTNWESRRGQEMGLYIMEDSLAMTLAGPGTMLILLLLASEKSHFWTNYKRSRRKPEL